MSIQGKVVVFTGKISKPRHEFQALVEEHGGIAGPDVSKNTDYLVVGEKPGSKLMRATTLGIPRISEEEFLKLLSQGKETDETPLTSEELAELEKHIVTLTCSNCNKTYKQWDTLPNYETCPICEILSPIPLCPHCNNEPTFVTDFNLYHCMLCGTWFKAPCSIHARHTKHLHLWAITKGLTKICPCGASITLSNEDVGEGKSKYEKAPSLVKKWTEESMAFGKIRKEEEEAFKFIESLTPEQITYLEASLREGYPHPMGKVDNLL